MTLGTKICTGMSNEVQDSDKNCLTDEAEVEVGLPAWGFETRPASTSSNEKGRGGATGWTLSVELPIVTGEVPEGTISTHQWKAALPPQIKSETPARLHVPESVVQKARTPSPAWACPVLAATAHPFQDGGGRRLSKRQRAGKTARPFA